MIRKNIFTNTSVFWPIPKSHCKMEQPSDLKAYQKYTPMQAILRVLYFPFFHTLFNVAFLH